MVMTVKLKRKADSVPFLFLLSGTEDGKLAVTPVQPFFGNTPAVLLESAVQACVHGLEKLEAIRESAHWAVNTDPRSDAEIVLAEARWFLRSFWKKSGLLVEMISPEQFREWPFEAAPVTRTPREQKKLAQRIAFLEDVAVRKYRDFCAEKGIAPVDIVD